MTKPADTDTPFIYYPYDNRNLSVSESAFGEGSMDVIEENSIQVPDTWPALYRMMADDESTCGGYWMPRTCCLQVLLARETDTSHSLRS